jgi:hypothetical protein
MVDRSVMANAQSFSPNRELILVRVAAVARRLPAGSSFAY